VLSPRELDSRVPAEATGARPSSAPVMGKPYGPAGVDHIRG
jgi:hypothetical protein